MKRSLTNWGLGLGVGVLAITVGHAASTTANFEKAFRIESNGKPIDAASGFAAPTLVDFDGDGIQDLLVGQRSECKLRIYRNMGSNTEPKFNVSAVFRAGGVEATLPGG